MYYVLLLVHMYDLPLYVVQGSTSYLYSTVYDVHPLHVELGLAQGQLVALAVW